MSDSDEFSDLASAVAGARACTLCASHLPLGPRPVLRVGAAARLLIVGQAPGTAVHATGIPWDDPSGARLRDWLAIDHDVFYDPQRVAILPVGLCYPGRFARGGDLPPRPECAPLWHPALTHHLPNIELTLLVGMYAQKYYLARDARKTLTETVAAWRDYGPRLWPTPHPSWRVTGWLKRNEWFGRDLLPELRARVRELV